MNDLNNSKLINKPSRKKDFEVDQSNINKIVIERSDIETMHSQFGHIECTHHNVLSEEKLHKILVSMTIFYDLNSLEESLFILYHFIQRGASARGCNGNFCLKIMDKNFKLSDIRKFFSEEGEKNGLRKLAKLRQKNILTFAKAIKIEGHLTSKIKRTNPDAKITEDMTYALCDFQCDNTEIDTEIRKLILNSFLTKSNYNKSKSKKK